MNFDLHYLFLSQLLSIVSLVIGKLLQRVMKVVIVIVPFIFVVQLILLGRQEVLRVEGGVVEDALHLVEQLDDPLLADGVPVVVEADLDGLLAALQPEPLRPRNRVLRSGSCIGTLVCMHVVDYSSLRGHLS